MLDVYVYKNRDNWFTLRLEATAVVDDITPDPPLQGASRVVVEMDGEVKLDTDVPGDEIEIIDDDNLRMRFGDAFSSLTEPTPAYLVVFYPDAPDGVAWPGSAREPGQPTFNLIPVDWS